MEEPGASFSAEEATVFISVNDLEKGFERLDFRAGLSVSHGIADRENVTNPELLANVNPTFSWVRLAQRVPVRVHIDQVPHGVALTVGMTCTVIVEPRAGTRVADTRRSLSGPERSQETSNPVRAAHRSWCTVGAGRISN